mmetsp:Transcript_10333/g.22904  ORF Transcript_10333/g.22904 Transcript_10333/m.22904 type:complete len:104 (+) Transcript_10333:44-355(+)
MEVMCWDFFPTFSREIPSPHVRAGVSKRKEAIKPPQTDHKSAATISTVIADWPLEDSRVFTNITGSDGNRSACFVVIDALPVDAAIDARLVDPAIAIDVLVVV